MSDHDPVRCPRCGGVAVKDLRRLRRGTGWGLMVGAVAVLAMLAAAPWRTPLWVLLSCVVVAALGLVALRGAAAARYCPTCDVRMVPPADGR